MTAQVNKADAGNQTYKLALTVYPQEGGSFCVLFEANNRIHVASGLQEKDIGQGINSVFTRSKLPQGVIEAFCNEVPYIKPVTVH